ncbi:MAG: hypothetical protein JWN35_2406 [Frankiales bacterium]|nr:hypothetical protein [Frankiales bacterium]
MDPDAGAGAVAAPLTGTATGALEARTTAGARHRAPGPRPHDRLRTAWVTGVPAFAILLGAVARLRQWTGDRSLWLDEVLIADNIVHRGFAALASEPLLHSQAAPTLWLWLERLSVDVFGPDERALRLVPLLAGLATMVLTWRLAARVVPAVLVPVAVVLVALQPSLIYYSNEVKQYSSDVAVVLVVVLLAIAVPPRAADGRALRRLALCGVVAVWLSHAAVLALAGVSLVLVLRPLLARDVRQAARTGLLLSPWLLSLAASSVTVLRPLLHNEPLIDYWHGTFPTSAADLPAWFGRRWYDLASTPLRMTVPLLGLALLTFGLGRLSRFVGRRAALLWAGVPMALVAAGLSAYPFAGRLALWLVPIAAVTLAATLPHRLDRRRVGWLLAGSAALTFSLGPAVAEAVTLTGKVQTVEELHPVLERLAKAHQPGDLVFVEVAARSAYDYYAKQTGVHRDGVILFLPRPGAAPCDDRPALRAGRFATSRVWVVTSHLFVDTGRLGTREDLLARVRTVSREVQHLGEPGADAFLFDPVGGPEAPVQTVPRNPERCLTVVLSNP